MDLKVLEWDAGLCRVLGHAESHGMRSRLIAGVAGGEMVTESVWRSVPSDSALRSGISRGSTIRRLIGTAIRAERTEAFIAEFGNDTALKAAARPRYAGLEQFVQSRLLRLLPSQRWTMEDCLSWRATRRRRCTCYKKY